MKIYAVLQPTMKTRRHHNNKGLRQIKNGATQKWADRMHKLIVVKKQEQKEK